MRSANDNAVDRVNCGPGNDYVRAGGNDIFIGVRGLPVTPALAGCETVDIVP
jgi:hypothetical protein